MANETQDIIVVGWCPGETVDAGTGGFNWGPVTPKNEEWATRELAALDHSIHNVYLARVKVPADLDQNGVTMYIDNNLEALEPGFLAPPKEN